MIITYKINENLGKCRIKENTKSHTFQYRQKKGAYGLSHTPLKTSPKCYLTITLAVF